MKTNRFVLCLRGLALLALFIVVPARAADGFYFGATGMLASSGAPGFDDAINAGAVLGYEFINVGVGDIAIEGSFTTSVSKGETGANQKWSLDTLSGYGVLRSAGPIYLKGKAGFTSWEFDTPGAGRDGTDFSWGLGVGFSFAIGQLEFEYTEIADDIDFYGVTLNIKTPK